MLSSLFIRKKSPCLRASVFLRLLGAPLRGCGLSALATSTSSRLVFKRRRHNKSSPYKNFANFANFAWDLIQVLYFSFPSWVLSKTRSLKTQRYSRSEKVCGACVRTSRQSLDLPRVRPLRAPNLFETVRPASESKESALARRFLYSARSQRRPRILSPS